MKIVQVYTKRKKLKVKKDVYIKEQIKVKKLKTTRSPRMC